jgi:cyclase
VALKRILPVLLLDGRRLVKTVQFKNPSYIGDPLNAIKIFNEKEVDELVLLDISASRARRAPQFDLIQECASECFMPFSYGGGVSSLNDFARLYKLGVEKVIVNTLCLLHPELVRRAAREFGSSSIVGSVDYRDGLFRRRRVFSSSGRMTRRGLLDHCRFLAEYVGVGELLLNSVDRDGTWRGYDVPTIREIAAAVHVPLVACGGAGSVADLQEVLRQTDANAAAIGSLAVYRKQGQGVLISFPARHNVMLEETQALT